ncbi:MAG: cytidine deaminase [Lachnospiraceae bacterium]|nr:cytidine deaminase [Lachnospiraceae bacterium]
MQNPSLSEEKTKELIRAALKVRKYAYTPYSHYQVGAALLCASKKNTYTGCNVENASFGATICAERSAFLQALSQGKRKFSAIAIVAGPEKCSEKDLVKEDYPTPCGICRQFMREFVDPAKFQVILARSTSDYKVMTLEELLPESFGPESL